MNRKFEDAAKAHVDALFDEVKRRWIWQPGVIQYLLVDEFLRLMNGRHGGGTGTLRELLAEFDRAGLLESFGRRLRPVRFRGVEVVNRSVGLELYNWYEFKMGDHQSLFPHGFEPLTRVDFAKPYAVGMDDEGNYGILVVLKRVASEMECLHQARKAA
jgi:hypothetical protein